MKKLLPDQDYLNSLFEYRDGKLYWKVKLNKRIIIGSLVGCENKVHGYYQVSFNKSIYKLHNIIWKLHTGNDPDGELDHINRDKSDNRIENLRDVSKSINQRNKNKSKNNTSGYPNIRILDKRYVKKFQVQFNIESYSKRFLTLEEAIQHRNEKYIEWQYTTFF